MVAAIDAAAELSLCISACALGAELMQGPLQASAAVPKSRLLFFPSSALNNFKSFLTCSMLSRVLHNAKGTSAGALGAEQMLGPLCFLSTSTLPTWLFV